jgi:hypothetical protein
MAGIGKPVPSSGGHSVQRFSPLAAVRFAAALLQRITHGWAGLFRYRFVAQPVPAARRLRAPTGATRIFEIKRDDPICAEFPRPAHVVASRFDQGARCVVGTKDGRFAGFIWFVDKQYVEDEVRCVYLLDGEDAAVWDFDVYVGAEHRSSRLFVQLWDSVNEALRESGVRWTISRISDFNEASLAAHAKMDLRPLGVATFLVMGAVQLLLTSRPFHLSVAIRRDRRPTLAVGLAGVRLSAALEQSSTQQLSADRRHAETGAADRFGESG